MVPLISVMIPCYNARKTLPVALASLVAQTYPNWECLLVDDGSTDNPEEVAKVFNDERVRYFRLNQNMGRGFARQYALELARGKYICMLDADDWIYPEKLERQLKIMENEPKLAILSTGMTIVDKSNRIIGVRVRGSRQTGVTLHSPLKRPKLPPFAYAPSMIRMDIARQFRYDQQFHLVEDTDYLLRILMHYPFGILSQSLYTYTEFQTVSIAKIVDALKATRIMFLKYYRSYPWSVVLNNTKQILKELLYRLGFALGFGDQLIERRSQKPTSTMIREFDIANRIVYATVTRVFADVENKSHYIAIETDKSDYTN